MNVLILFWLNYDNFAGIIIDPQKGEEAKINAIRKWEHEHDYNKDTILAVQYYIKIDN